MLFAVLGALSFTYVGLLAPQARVLVQARDALCAGDTDFVTTRDGLGAFAWSYPDGLAAEPSTFATIPTGSPRTWRNRPVAAP